MNNYICKQPSLSVNYRNEIVEMDQNGNIVGAWYGYYNPKRFTVKLYPNRKHPFVKWQRSPEITTISAQLVKCDRNTKNSNPKPVKSHTTKGIREITGQEKIKF